MPRPWLIPVLVLLLAGRVPAQPAPDAQRAADLALRDWSHAIGTTGYVYGAPLFDAAIAEYRQSAALDEDLAGPRGVLAHAMGGGLATHATTWQPAPDPDVLASVAWLDLREQPFVLYVPPLEGTWYCVRFLDDFGSLAGSLSPRSSGSVGGWTLVARSDFEGPLPPRLQGEVRVATPGVRVIVEIAATPGEAAAFHQRYQAKLKLLPLEVYRRSPAAAEFAIPRPQAGDPPLRATEEMRSGLDAFRVINQKLRRIGPAPGEEALLGLFDRAGFGPHVDFDPSRLAAPQRSGLREAARDARRALRDLHLARAARRGWHAPPATDPGDYLARAGRGIGAAPAADLLTLEAHRDTDGRRLDGRVDYRIRFAAGARPPADAFWTLAAYAADSERLFDTGTGRYSVGRASEDAAAGGERPLELWISSDPPDDPSLRDHWLPVGTEAFFLVARLRAPGTAALDGSWSMPGVEPVD